MSARSVIESALAKATDPKWKAALVEFIDESRNDGVPDEVIAENIQQLEADGEALGSFIKSELGAKKP
jgi:hypothetical protein